jgi:hypothetical protein
MFCCTKNFQKANQQIGNAILQKKEHVLVVDQMLNIRIKIYSKCEKFHVKLDQHNISNRKSGIMSMKFGILAGS